MAMLSLVADYDTESSSSSRDDDTYDEATEEKKTKEYSSFNHVKPSATVKLPSANSILKGRTLKSSGDVFNNPFLEAEKLEIDKLQKHVKMVESENNLLQKNGRKICWNNRKGRCRFGNKCKYAHDSDLVEADEAINKKELKTPATRKSGYTLELETMDQTNDCSDILQKRKRPGLGDSIVPGKRAMNAYHNTKKSTL